jgi:hypothetical protein
MTERGDVRLASTSSSTENIRSSGGLDAPGARRRGGSMLLHDQRG